MRKYFHIYFQLKSIQKSFFFFLASIAILLGITPLFALTETDQDQVMLDAKIDLAQAVTATPVAILHVGRPNCSEPYPSPLPKLANEDQKDRYEFDAKGGKVYEISAIANGDNNSIRLDPQIDIVDKVGNKLVSNDDENDTSVNSKVIFIPPSSDTYSIIVSASDFPSGASSDTYCLEIKLTNPPTPVPTTPPSTRIPFDECEDNLDFDSACLIGVGDAKTFNFVPVTGDGPDNDFFKIHLKQGAYVYCETSNLSPANDTNMIVYDINREGLGGNDDIDTAAQNLGSGVSFFAATTGLYYILVGPGPALQINYANSAQFSYDLSCEWTDPPTPTPAPVVPTPIPAAVVPAAVNAPLPETGEGLIAFEPESGEIGSFSGASSPFVRPLKVKSSAQEVEIEPTTKKSVIFQIGLGAANGSIPITNMPLVIYSTTESPQRLLAISRSNENGQAKVTLEENIQEVVLHLPYLNLRTEIELPEDGMLEVSINIGPR